MPCEVYGNTIICSRGSRKQPLCVDCGRPSTLLCDGPLPKGILYRRSSVPGGDSTCSRPICRACAWPRASRKPGDDKDYCAFCWPLVNTETDGATAL